METVLDIRNAFTFADKRAAGPAHRVDVLGVCIASVASALRTARTRGTT